MGHKKWPVDRFLFCLHFSNKNWNNNFLCNWKKVGILMVPQTDPIFTPIYFDPKQFIIKWIMTQSTLSRFFPNRLGTHRAPSGQIVISTSHYSKYASSRANCLWWLRPNCINQPQGWILAPISRVINWLLERHYGNCDWRLYIPLIISFRIEVVHCFLSSLLLCVFSLCS